MKYFWLTLLKVLQLPWTGFIGIFKNAPKGTVSKPSLRKFYGKKSTKPAPFSDSSADFFGLFPSNSASPSILWRFTKLFSYFALSISLVSRSNKSAFLQLIIGSSVVFIGGLSVKHLFWGKNSCETMLTCFLTIAIRKIDSLMELWSVEVILMPRRSSPLVSSFAVHSIVISTRSVPSFVQQWITRTLPTHICFVVARWPRVAMSNSATGNNVDGWRCITAPTRRALLNAAARPHQFICRPRQISFNII